MSAVTVLPLGCCVYCGTTSARLGEFCPTSDPQDPDLHYFTPSGSRDEMPAASHSTPVGVSSGQPGVHGTASTAKPTSPSTPLGASGLTLVRDKGEPT